MLIGYCHLLKERERSFLEIENGYFNKMVQLRIHQIKPKIGVGKTYTMELIFSNKNIYLIKKFYVGIELLNLRIWALKSKIIFKIFKKTF